VYTCRGHDFCRAFAEIGSIRSLLHKSVKIIALTATATKETLESATQCLTLENPAIVGLPPNRSNIKYVVENNTDVATFCRLIVDELTLKRAQMKKTVVFGRSLQNCATIFATIKKMMGKYVTDPPGATYHGSL